MVHHRQLMFKNKYLSLMANYGVEVEAGQVGGWTPPLSYRAVPALVAPKRFLGRRGSAVCCVMYVEGMDYCTQYKDPARVQDQARPENGGGRCGDHI